MRQTLRRLSRKVNMSLVETRASPTTIKGKSVRDLGAAPRGKSTRDAAVFVPDEEEEDGGMESDEIEPSLQVSYQC